MSTMNNLPEGHQADDGENRGWGVEEDGPFVPRTLLGYATPRAIDFRGPIRLPLIVGDPSSYDASMISILQNNCYYGMEYEDLYDHIRTFLQCLITVWLNGASEDYIRLVFFLCILKGTWVNLSIFLLSKFFPDKKNTKIRA
jgi:hypothetical protein